MKPQDHKTLRTLVALAFLAAASGAFAQRYAPQEFDFSELAGIGADAGIVESVREVPLREMHAFDPEVLELKHKPETVQELDIRLDGGHVITVTRSTDLQRLQLGQRVRVMLTNTGALIEPQ
jgi:hypothetical protein